VPFLDSRALFAAGLASYSLFLWHDPLVREFREVGLTLDGRGGFIANLALLGLVAGVASALTYRLVERPALKLKRPWQRREGPSAEDEPMGTPGPAGEPPALGARIEALAADVAGVRRGEVELFVPQRLDGAVDQGTFDAIFKSLLENALSYGKPPVRVVLEAGTGELVLTVEDRGRGVSPSFVPHLFEPFSRSEASRREIGGKGLGLARAKRIVDDLGGTIRYADARPRGARFQVVLPLAGVETPDRATGDVKAKSPARGWAPRRSHLSLGRHDASPSVS
jgi:hypothetical protein